MSHPTQPDSIKAAYDHEAVLIYQANYLAQKFSMAPATARAFVDRYGLDRAALNQAVQEQLVQARMV
jgi:hypothetical protein